MVLRNSNPSKLTRMDPINRRITSHTASRLPQTDRNTATIGNTGTIGDTGTEGDTEVNRGTPATITSTGTSASFTGSPEAIKSRLNRANEIAQGLNRQLGNLLHFIQQSSYLALEAEGDKPQEILWVASNRSESRYSGESEQSKNIRLEKGLAELPSALRVKVERFIDNPSVDSSKDGKTSGSVTRNYGWSYEVLLLRPDQEVVPEATISYPALRLNDDGNVCFLADFYPDKLTANETAIPAKQRSSEISIRAQGTSNLMAVKSNTSLQGTIDVAQLFWDALVRAGAVAEIPLHTKKG